MVWVAGGECQIGSDAHYRDERPAHRQSVCGFWVDRYPVTNVSFAEFVDETGHVTVAERMPDFDECPDAAAEVMHPGSLVFVQPTRPVDLRDLANWWAFVPGADWRHPYGPDSTLEDLGDHPVVHVTYADVEAYAAWAGKQIPTEAEWEFAARGGLDGAAYAWGDDFMPNGRIMANTWQGQFPYENLCMDGYDRTSPVDAFSPNGYGVFDMIGNVWEWTSDWYRAAAPVSAHGCCGSIHPRSAGASDSYDPAQPAMRLPRKVLKGGSHLCAPNYSRRYRPAARQPQVLDTSMSHIGFRCIVRPAQMP
jgi:formylglycine-generating enzyme